MSSEFILFDNDGTLYRIGEDFRAAVIEKMLRYISRYLGITEEQATKERKRLIKKYNVESTEFVFGLEYGMPYEDFVNNTYLTIGLESHGIQHDRRLYTMLHRAAQKKSVLTNNPSEFALKILKVLGVDDVFEHIIGSRELCFFLKPDIKAFEIALNMTGYAPEQTFFIDDVKENMSPAKSFGMKTALVGASHSHADYTLRTIYDLGKLLEECA